MNKKIIRLITVTGLFYTIAFTVTAFVFIFLHPQLMAIINAVSQKIFPALPLAHEQSQFYKILCLSMMSGVTVCSLLLYKDAQMYIAMVIPLCTMKFTSSLCGLTAFIGGSVFHNGWNNLANIIIVITDFPLGLWIFSLFIVYRRYNNECINYDSQ